MIDKILLQKSNFEIIQNRFFGNNNTNASLTTTSTSFTQIFFLQVGKLKHKMQIMGQESGAAFSAQFLLVYLQNVFEQRRKLKSFRLKELTLY